MRRALLQQLPALSRVYGLLPHHLDDMSLLELEEYQSDLRKLLARGEA